MSEDNASVIIDQSATDVAYDDILPEAKTLPVESLITINLDIPTVVFAGLTVCKKLPAFQAELKALPGLASKVERFPNYVLALYAAQVLYKFAVSQAEETPALLVRATKWRDVLTADAKALVIRGHLDGRRLDGLSGQHGYKNVVFDLSGLCKMYKSAWSTLQSVSGLKAAELVEADQTALELAEAVTDRDLCAQKVAAASEARQRMFTLYCSAYKQIRTGVGYLRWNEDDVDDFMPSLYAGRPNTNIGKKNNGEPAGQTPTPPVAPAPAVIVQPAEPTVVNKVPVGYPGSEPLSAT
jgi:hypothetical protein